MVPKRVMIFLIVVFVFSFTFSAFTQEMLMDTLDFSKLKHQKYYILQEDNQGITGGYLTIDITPQEDEKYKFDIDFNLGDDHFSNSFTATKDDDQNLFNNLFFSNPMTMAVIMPVFAVQFMLLPVTLMGGELKEGFTWSTSDNGEEMTIQVPSSEERFGFKAHWVEILKNQEVIVRMLISKDAPLPFVVEIKDSETLEEGQKSLYLELLEWDR